MSKKKCKFENLFFIKIYPGELKKGTNQVKHVEKNLNVYIKLSNNNVASKEKN